MTDNDINVLSAKESLFKGLIELNHASRGLQYMVTLLPDGSGDSDEDVRYLVGLASDQLVEILGRLMESYRDLPE